MTTANARSAATAAPADPVVVGVLQELLVSVVREMRVTFARSAFSPIITEGHDFSCALLAPDGELLAMSEDNPSHIFPLAYAAKTLREKYGADIHEGDIFIVNDPYLGTHMNDVAILCPRVSGERGLVYAGVRGHWGDVGGSVAGSLSGNASHLFQEGVRIPVLALYRGGRVNKELLELLLSNMRDPAERQGDLNAMVGTANLAARRLADLEKKFGLDVMQDVSEVLRNRAEWRFRQAIQAWPKGVYRYENYLDNSGTGSEPLRISLSMKVREDSIDCDFTGSSPQVRGPNNGSLATTAAACLIALKTFLDPKGPVNGGCFRPLTLTAPEGTIVNATFPSPMGGFSETRRATEATLMGAIAQVIPDLCCGEVKSSANHCYVSGVRPEKRTPFLYYEYPAGGTGAVSGLDGEDAVRGYAEGDFNTVLPIESLERSLPMLVESTTLRQDSAGPGRWRGGFGMQRKVRIETTGAALTVLADRVVIPPTGICGGESAAGNRFTVFRDGKRIEPDGLPGKVTSFPLLKDDVLCLESGGGGGFGDPLQREPKAVLHDVLLGVLTIDEARTSYGVVITGTTIDFVASLALRNRIAGKRVQLKVVAVQDDHFEGIRRVCEVSPASAAAHGLQHSQLVEYVAPHGWPLRAFVRINETVADGSTPLGPRGAE
jgi:N-methylhydantoinase B